MSGFILSYPIGNAKSKSTKNYTSLSEMKSDKSIPDGTVGSVSEYGWITMKEAKALEKVVNVPKLKDTGLAEDEIQYIDTNHLDFKSCLLMIYNMLGLGGPIYLFKSKEGDKVYLWYLETFFSRNRKGIGLRKVLANSTPLKKYEPILLILVSILNLVAMENGMLEFNNAAAQQKDSKWFTLLFNELLKRLELSLWLDNHDYIHPKSDDLLKEYEEEAKLELIDSGIENVFRVPGLKNSTLYIKENGLWTNICNTHTYEDEETLLSSSAQNGDIAVTNNGTYIRANDKWKDIDSYKKVTWQKLKDLRDGGNLNPGSLYRITDYQCTTTQENTQSAGHQFDIVLLALSENKLAEEGWAMMHDNIYDVTFNDGVTKKCYYYPLSVGNFHLVICDTLLGTDEIASDEYTIDESSKTMVIDWASTELTLENITYNYFQNSNLSAWKVWYCLDNDKTRFAWADNSVDEDSDASINVSSSGNISNYQRSTVRDAVIEDENYYAWATIPNPAQPYIKEYVCTKTETPNSSSKLYNVIQGGSPFAIELTSTVDSYIPAHQGTGLENGRGVIYRLIDEFNNDIKYDFKNIQFMRTITDGQYDKMGIVTWCYTFNVWYNDMCQDASIVGNILPNDEGYIIGVYDNILGYATSYNLFLAGVDTFDLVLGNNVFLTLVDGGFYYGIFSNVIGNDSHGNTIGDRCSNNIIGNMCFNNTIGSNFHSNTIGNDVNGNIICSNFHSNTIGNRVTNNIIGTNDGYVRYLRVEDGVQYVEITTSATPSSSAYLQNIIIGKGVAGALLSPKTITHPTVGDTMQTTYVPTNSTTVNV